MSAVRDLLYVAVEELNAIAAFKVAPDGRLALAPNSPVALPEGSNTYNVDVDPQGRFRLWAQFRARSVGSRAPAPSIRQDGSTQPRTTGMIPCARSLSTSGPAS